MLHISRTSFIAFFLIVWWLLPHTVAAERGPYELKWLYYDAQAELYTPYFPSYHGSVNSLFLVVPKSYLEGKKMVWSSGVPTYLYLQQKLVAHANAGEEQELDFSTFQTFRISQGDLQLMFYTGGSFSAEPQVRFVLKGQSGSALGMQRRIQAPIAGLRERGAAYTPYLVVGFSLLFAFTFFLERSSPVMGFFELDTYLKNLLRGLYDEQQLNLVQALTTIVFYAFSLGLALALLVAHSGYGKKIPLISYTGSTVFYEVLSFSLICLLLILVRLLLIRMLSGIYGLSSVGTQHSYEYLKINQAYATFALFVTLMVILLGTVVYQEWLVWLLVGGYLGKSFIVALKINKILPLKKIYLFSYFCTAEFIPTLIGLKFFLG